MKQLPIATAKNINEAHRLARSTAEKAVEHAIECGRLLAAKKEELAHGEFTPWVEKHCDFSDRQARRYMQAADKTDTRVRFDSLRQLIAPPVPREPKTKDSPKGAVSVVNPEGGRTAAAREGTEETGKDRPAAPVFDSAPAPNSDDYEPERADIDDAEEDAALARAEARAKEDRERRVDKIFDSDDQLAESLKQLAQQSALIGTLETTRDGYMRGKETVTKMLQAEQRKVAKLEKEVAKLRAENEALRERISIMEAA